MKYLLLPSLAAALILVAAGCDEGAKFVTESDTSIADADAASGDVPVTTTDVATDLPQAHVPDATITPGPNCGPVIPNQNTKGPKVPWGGLVYEGKTYTCNECPGGLQIQEGRWRHIDGKTEDPDVPLDDDYRERLELSGNTWSFVSDGTDSFTNTFETQTVSGWYFCGDASEISTRGSVFVVTSVANPGAFGWQEGIVITAELLMDGPLSGMIFNWRDGIAPGGSTQDLYCRIGSTVSVEGTGGAPNSQKLCKDPFE
ncbi:MAG: hypothetical protein R3F39_22865 [Myxococcota bacterium]